MICRPPNLGRKSIPAHTQVGRKPRQALRGQSAELIGDDCSNRGRRFPLRVGKSAANGKFLPVGSPHAERTKFARELSLSCLVGNDHGFRIIIRLDLEQGR